MVRARSLCKNVMLTAEIKELDRSFSQLVKRRRGQMIRRGGAGSRDFEMSFPAGAFEVLVGVEAGTMTDDNIFVFIRHGRAALVRHPADPFFLTPPESDVLDPEVPDPLVKARLVRAGKAGQKGTATPAAPAGSRDGEPDDALPATPTIPGFSIRCRPMDFTQRLYRSITGRRVFVDPARPGWFHVEMQPGDPLETVLPEILRDPVDRLVRSATPLTKLSVAMTSQVFRIRRVPVSFELESIDHFVTLCLELFWTACVAPPEPPAIGATSGFQLFDVLLEGSSQARCGVCGEETAARRVQCVKCLTPHHDECWRYGGGCSVYGCGSTVSRQ